jgi:hypothetical protein
LLWGILEKKKMKKNLTIILLLTLLSSCGKTTQKDNVSLNEKRQKTEYTFSEYSEKIPIINLPFSSTCDIELKGSRFGFTDKEISKYGRKDCYVYGKLVDNEKYTAIIYLLPCDIVLPIIQTTDKKGTKISELELHDSYCGEDEFSWGSSGFTINKDLTIQITDSANSFERDDKAEIIESTKKVTVKHRQFYISENGKIAVRK